jgi:ferrous iron transport protein A
MGFTAGVAGEVVRKGCFRGPLQIRLRGYNILIRRFEAAGIEIEPAENRTAAQ